jgi:hypothetical protein
MDYQVVQSYGSLYLTARQREHTMEYNMSEKTMEEQLLKMTEATAAARKALELARKALELAEAEEAALKKKIQLAKSAKNDTKATGASGSAEKATDFFQRPMGIVKDPRMSVKKPKKCPWNAGKANLPCKFSDRCPECFPDI